MIEKYGTDNPFNLLNKNKENQTTLETSEVEPQNTSVFSLNHKAKANPILQDLLKQQVFFTRFECSL